MPEVCTFEQLIMIKIVIENVCGKGDVPDDMKCCFLLEPFKSCSLIVDRWSTVSHNYRGNLINSYRKPLLLLKNCPMQLLNILISVQI